MKKSLLTLQRVRMFKRLWTLRMKAWMIRRKRLPIYRCLRVTVKWKWMMQGQQARITISVRTLNYTQPNPANDRLEHFIHLTAIPHPSCTVISTCRMKSLKHNHPPPPPSLSQYIDHQTFFKYARYIIDVDCLLCLLSRLNTFIFSLFQLWNVLVPI